ncbi:Small integral membrane protein 20 [Exaiptasia diaphana]|nr:Small integral membrane protein 20 [Exaiptasia diaphana]
MSSKVKSTLVIGGIVAITAAALFPIVIYPKLYPEVYRDIQKETRNSINQEDIQPGNMKVWSDPFKKQ